MSAGEVLVGGNVGLAARIEGARVLVIGAGGLGCPAMLALAARGLGHLTILDPDRVERSNLHRQILYTEADVGRPKAECAARTLEQRFPRLRTEALVGAFEAKVHDLVFEFDVVLDGTDLFETKLAIADACADRSIDHVFAGVVAHEGQVLAVRPGRSACVRCLFDEAPPPGAAPTCAEVGIVGPIAGVVGARQARAALALLSSPAGVEAAPGQSTAGAEGPRSALQARGGPAGHNGRADARPRHGARAVPDGTLSAPGHNGRADARPRHGARAVPDGTLSAPGHNGRADARPRHGARAVPDGTLSAPGQIVSPLDGQDPVLDRIWVYDGLRDRARTVPLRRAADCRGCGARRDQRGAVAELEAPAGTIDAPVLDLGGAACPTTYIEAGKALDRLPAGGRLWVHFTSDESARNVPRSVVAAGHKVLARLSDGRTHRVLLERGSPEERN